MCSSKDLVTEPFVRFGTTKEAFDELRTGNFRRNHARLHERICSELPFFDREAALLQKLLLDNQDNVPLCGLVAAMMYCVHEHVQSKLGKKKPERQNTYGMFFAPPTSAEQVVKA